MYNSNNNINNFNNNIMTAKEKAKELFDKYVELSGIFVGDYESEKEMCLIAVDELLNNFLSNRTTEYGRERYHFWQQVKQEIKKL